MPACLSVCDMWPLQVEGVPTLFAAKIVCLASEPVISLWRAPDDLQVRMDEVDSDGLLPSGSDELEAGDDQKDPIVIPLARILYLSRLPT